MRIVLALTLFLATLCFALGVTLPLVELRRFVFLVERPSLIEVVLGLWNANDPALALLIGLFSLVFPALKLVYLNLVAIGGGGLSVPAAFKTLSNWSMLDVMLVAVVIFAARTSGLATALSQPGLWFFTAATLLTALASALAARSSREG